MKKTLRVLLISAGSALGVLALVAAWAHLRAQRATREPRAIAYPDLALPRGDARRGERLAQVRYGCVECHAKDLGGAPVVNDPMVASLSGSNLTPAALKGWTDQEIARAIRSGVSRDGRPLLLMPSQDYRHLSLKDLADLIAYLRSVPPVDRPSEPSKLGPVFTALYAFGKLPTLTPVDVVDHAAPPAAGPAEAATPEFGKYLARASCMGCHGEALKGGPIPGGDPKWPAAANITPDALATWDEGGFVKTLRTGVNPGGSRLAPPMVVEYTKKYSDVELKALWAYIRSLPTTEL